jgi:hypothetical protein
MPEMPAPMMTTSKFSALVERWTGDASPMAAIRLEIAR